MRISRPLARSAALAATLGLTTAALAQDSPRQAIDNHGQDAMDRLEGAVAKARNDDGRVPDPRLPKVDRPADRHRAFEDLRKRVPAPDMEARARVAKIRGDASLAAERERQAAALRKAFGLEPSEEQALAKAAVPSQAKGWVPVLFVSSSMPLATLRAYAVQLEKTHGVMAFRGMPGGLKKVGPMARLTAQILRLDPGCEGPACAMRNVQLIIDPIVFRQHGIARVPALAMIPGDPTQAYCERDDDSVAAAHIVYGDSALPGLLDEYARLGGKEEVRHVQALLAPR
ncbi:MAG TPA: type-F conjugative transfer system pilin assembly protein TrbC [Novosphingobium sp.]|nr:type-F conjugative transfer system pilin assembly protein TrbC [Novosphingobium sp.]